VEREILTVVLLGEKPFIGESEESFLSYSFGDGLFEVR